MNKLLSLLCVLAASSTYAHSRTIRCDLEGDDAKFVEFRVQDGELQEFTIVTPPTGASPDELRETVYRDDPVIRSGVILPRPCAAETFSIGSDTDGITEEFASTCQACELAAPLASPLVTQITIRQGFPPAYVGGSFLSSGLINRAGFFKSCQPL
jgi:hypothetical protein